MSNTPVAEALNVVLADTYALYLKTQNYHWNVESPNFLALHLMFETQYTELATAVDDIATDTCAWPESTSDVYGLFGAFLDV